MRWTARDERGQELVEYAIVFILLMLLIFGIMEFAVIVFTQNSLSNAAREGARYAVVRPHQSFIPPNDMTKFCPGNTGPYPEIFERVCDRLPGIASPSNASVNIVKVAGPAVTVRVSYTYNPLFGLIDPLLPSGLTLGSQATMRLE